MNTLSQVYAALLGYQPIRFDSYTGEGTVMIMADDRRSREEILEDILKFLAVEYYAMPTAIYLQERLWTDAQNYSLPLRVVYRSVITKN